VKIYSVVIAQDQVLLESEVGSDFWAFLGEGKGWARFSMLRPLQEKISGRSFFRVTEVLPPEARPPVAVIELSEIHRSVVDISKNLGQTLNLPTDGTVRLPLI
jgi:hypothetical protein